MSDMERLEEIRARCEAATPGPWRGDRHDGSIKYAMYGADDTAVLTVDHKDATSGFLGDRCVADEEFVLHSRADVSWLLAEIERLRSELEAAKATSTDRAKAGTWVRAGAVWLDMRHVAAVIAPLPGYEGGDVAVYGALTHDPDSANDWRIDFESAGEILAYVQEHQYGPA